MSLLPWRGRTNKKAFLERFKRAVAEKFPNAHVTPAGELELDVVFPNGTKHNLYLGRAYAAFCKKPSDVDEIVMRWLSAVDEDPQAQPTDLSKVVPMIKGRDWLGQIADASSHWIEDYNEHLVIAYAERNPMFRFCLRKRIEALGVTLEDARERALANLAALSTRREISRAELAYIVNVGGNFEASQILLDELWADPHIDERALVSIPDRDTLALSLDDTPGAVWRLAEAAARLSRCEPYPITSLLFARPDGGPLRAIDSAQEDASHPIPRLDVIDVNGIRRGGGADLLIVIASPLDDSARSIFRLFTKIDRYLNDIATEEFRRECGPPSPETTRIVVRIHARSAPEVFELLEAAAPWARVRNARLDVELLGR
jgi:uncharacterized protein YtpQ (UPF0354 family)